MPSTGQEIESFGARLGGGHRPIARSDLAKALAASDTDCRPTFRQSCLNVPRGTFSYTQITGIVPHGTFRPPRQGSVPVGASPGPGLMPSAVAGTRHWDAQARRRAGRQAGPSVTMGRRRRHIALALDRFSTMLIHRDRPRMSAG
jgi:hypothetical protein